MRLLRRRRSPAKRPHVEPRLTGWRDATPWVVWISGLVLVVVGLVPYRRQLDQVDAVLPLLIVVLFGSAARGRALGFTLALLGFAAIDYFFQPPFDTLAVDKGHDWLVLGAYLIAAGLAAHLLARARAEATGAVRRAAEVRRLAELGAETLAAGRADESLHATAEVIRKTLGLRRCDIFVANDDGAARWVTGTDDRVGVNHVRDGVDVIAAASDVLRNSAARAAKRSRVLGQVEDILVEATSVGGAASGTFLPLYSHQRAVGVLRLVHDHELMLDESQRTFLAALSHYAALAAERVRLVADAEQATALREADRLKDMVLASVSHDLRTPLTTIKALAHAAARRGDPDAAAIEEEADRLERMVTDVLDLSRARSGAIPLTLELNAAADLVGAAVRQTKGLFIGRRLERFIDEEETVLVGRFEFVASLRVLGNLLENAAKYAPSDLPVELRVRRDGAELVFEVADRGPGVAEAERLRIFAPFYRSPQGAADVGGAGLGLAVAAALAAAQGGTVGYTPRPGGGSVFTLRLPATDVEEAGLEAADDAIAPADVGPSRADDSGSP